MTRASASRPSASWNRSSNAGTGGHELPQALRRWLHQGERGYRTCPRCARDGDRLDVVVLVSGDGGSSGSLKSCRRRACASKSVSGFEHGHEPPPCRGPLHQSAGAGPRDSRLTRPRKHEEGRSDGAALFVVRLLRQAGAKSGRASPPSWSSRCHFHTLADAHFSERSETPVMFVRMRKPSSRSTYATA